jgi:dTDP-4-dehydrorhamnose 3,5-epimerase
MPQRNDTWLLPGAQKDAQSTTQDWQFANQRLIDGVFVKEIKPVATTYGYLTEIFRGDWLAENTAVDQVFQSWLAPGRISAWHAHELTTDRLFVSQGTLRIVLYDNRAESSTRGSINQFRLGARRPALVVVPPKVWHGVQNAGAVPAVLINTVDRAYRYQDPDHWRLPVDSPDVPFTFTGTT